MPIGAFSQPQVPPKDRCRRPLVPPVRRTKRQLSFGCLRPVEGIQGLRELVLAGMKQSFGALLGPMGVASVVLYNWHRPHGSLNASTPISRLGLSEEKLLRLHS
jgi:hypothetical protein